jgi:PmbA protein
LKIIEHIIELALKSAEQAEVFHVSNNGTIATYEANRLKLMETQATEGAALRIIKNGRIGFAATTDLSNPQSLVDTAVEVAPFGPYAKLAFPTKTTYPNVTTLDKSVENYQAEKMVETGQTLIDQLRSIHADVNCEGRVGKSFGTQTIMNSRGGIAQHTASSFGVYLHGTLIQGEDMLFVGDGETSCSPIEDTDVILKSVTGQIENARKIANSPSGSLPVIFTPHGVSSILLGPLLTGFNGRTVLQGSSPLIGKLGQQILDSQITIWDDPTLSLVPGSSPSDDEGVASKRKIVIDQGIAATFLYDLQTAGQAGTASTGNGSRSLTSLPAPSSTVLIINEGAESYADMVRDIPDGIIVEQVLGAGQGNILAGEFNANVLLGYRINNGEIIGRVKDCVISGNVYNVLNSIEAIGTESRWIGGSLKTPAIYCRSVSVTSKE